MMHAKIQQRIDQCRGFSLVEMIFYVALLALVATSSIAFLFSLSDMFERYRAEQYVYRSASTVLERMLFDIRDAETVTAASYTYPGSLTLSGGSATIVYATSSDNAIHVTENGVDMGALTSDRVVVTDLRFYPYDDVTELVRIYMTLRATVGESTVEKTFNAGAVLRGSYEE